MSDTVLIALITAFPPTIVATAAVVVALRTRKAVETTHNAVNSKMDALLALTAEVAALKATHDERERVRKNEQTR